MESPLQPSAPGRKALRKHHKTCRNYPVNITRSYQNSWNLNEERLLRVTLSCWVFPVLDARADDLPKMPRSDRSKSNKHEVGELSLLVNGLSFSSLDVGSLKDAIRKLDARLEENTAR